MTQRRIDITHYADRPNLRPKRAEQAELASQTEAFLAAGGVIQQLPAMVRQPIEPYRDPVTGYSLEQASAAGKRGAARKHGNRGNARPGA